MPEKQLTRRRALTIMAAAVALPQSAAARRSEFMDWRGTALGANARILLSNADEAATRTTLNEALAEIARLEAVFSLYQPRSEIVRLNEHKRLTDASLDLRRLLHLSRRMHLDTDGLFDPTIQSLWRFYAHWFGSLGMTRPPKATSLKQVLRSVGFDNVVLDGSTVALRNGAEISLNGIAQGYITDRIAGLLRARGWRHVLLDLGEARALDGRPDGRPWHIAVRDSNRQFSLHNAALATSASNALTFSPSVDASHIIDPQTARSAPAGRQVTVMHRSAAIADALSTSLLLAPAAQTSSIMARFPDARAWWQT